MSLVQLLRSSDGIPSTSIASKLASDAVRDLISSFEVSKDDLVAVEKNIRRRLYDSLKVLVSVGAIRRRPDKTLYWQGVTHLIPSNYISHSPSQSQHRAQSLSNSIEQVQTRLKSKPVLLQHLIDQVNALEHLNHRNTTQETEPASPKLQLPFVLVRTPSTSDIKLETTKDATSLAFHFSEPFEVINDFNILDRLFFVADTNQNEQLLESVNPPSSPTTSQLETTPPKRINLVSHSVHQTPTQRRPEELPSPASLIGSAQKRQKSLRNPPLETPRQSPKRRRVSGPSQFVKFTSGDKPPISPGTPLLRVPRRKKTLRRINIRSPLQASLNALAASPSSFQKSPRGDDLSRSPESSSSRGEDVLCTPESALRRQVRLGSPGKFADSLAESFLKSPEVRSSGPLKKRIYGPGRDALLSENPAIGEGVTASDQVTENADIMLSPGMTPLQGFGSRSPQSPADSRPVARRLFVSD